jgi:3-oxoacyl-[acyl-carrier-protein] synthase II
VRRVVVTGIGIVSPVGNDLASVTEALRNGRSGVRAMDPWREVRGLRSLVGGVAAEFDAKRLPRSARRTMGRSGVMAALAAVDAVDEARLDAGTLASGRVGLAMASTTGSPVALHEFFSEFDRSGIEGQKGTTFMKVMGHSIAANVGLHLGTTGRLLSPTSACASSAQSIGLGFETVRHGLQDVMICGGADELHPITAGTFDIVHAASTGYNDRPKETPRPFDARRDGLVVAEGAAALVLEDRERALARGAGAHAEVLSYATCGSGVHISAPSKESILQCIRHALGGAGLSPSEIDYVNAHATATEIGDAVEAAGTVEIFGPDVPVSSTKGHTGHTLAASGGIEAVFCIQMMREGFIAPTLNLERVAEDCAGARHVQRVLDVRPRRVMTNSFAFGGVNASLVLGAPE